MSEKLESLLARRVLVVTGKGGTGKTSVAAALAHVAARRGIDTVLVEVSQDGGLARLAGGDGAPENGGDGRQPVPIAPHLFFIRIEPEEALTEYLELELRVRVLAALVVRNPGFRRLLAAAPGWRELITLGKLWHLETRRANGGPRWGLLVVDAPSTGHGLSFLSVPGVVVRTVRLGPLRRHAQAVQELLTDSTRTLVVPVTLPEELPVRETLELLARLRELGLAAGPIVANGVEPPPLLAHAPEVLAALARLRAPEGAPALVRPEALRASIEHARRRSALQRGFLDQLRSELDCPVVELPYLTNGVAGPEGVAALARELEGAVSAAREAP